MLQILEKKTFLFFYLVFVLLGLWGLYHNISYEEREFDVEGALRATATKNYLENKILEAISSESFDDVEMYQNLANFLHITLSQSTIDEIEKHNDFFSKSWRNTKDFTTGFVSGESDSMVGISGSMLSDLSLVGDVRDLTEEGAKYARDESYDEIVLGVAAVGVALSASQVLTAGTSTPLKVGASVVKVAKKTGKLSKPFLKFISSQLKKTVDMKLLKKVDFSDMTKIESTLTSVIKNLNFTHMRKLFGDINIIKKNTSVMDTVSLMKYINKPTDLGKIVKLSKKFKGNTKAVLKVLGEGALKGGTKVLKYTAMFLAQIIMLIMSSVLFVLAFGTKMFIWNRVKNIL